MQEAVKLQKRNKNHYNNSKNTEVISEPMKLNAYSELFTLLSTPSLIAYRTTQLFYQCAYFRTCNK